MNRRIGREGREGQALAEFAIILPVLVILLLGIMEFGLLLYNQQVITNASREGARYGIVAREARMNLTEITAVVDAYAGSRMITFGSDTPTTTMVITDKDTSEEKTGGIRFGDNLTVTVTFDYDFLVLPNFIGSLGGVTTLEAQTTMKYE